MSTSRVRARLNRALVSLTAGLASACAGASAPDLVIRHAKVFTNDTARPWAEAVAIKGERVVAVGDDAAIAALAGTSTRVVDAGGRVLVPGFNDARVDLSLQPPSPQALAALDRDAVAHGVTSLQVVAGSPMRSLVVAAQQAERAARWRLIRAPMDGERPQDEEPYLPPQPGVRLVANGVSWSLGPWLDRTAGDAQLETFVKWAYGAEDPLIFAIQGDRSAASGGKPTGLEAMTAVVATLRRHGVPEVWQRKRPRLDVYGRLPVDSAEHQYDLDARSAQAVTLAELGVVVTAVPLLKAERTFVQDAPDLGEPVWFDHTGVVVAVGSGRSRTLIGAMADFNDPAEDPRLATVTNHWPRRATVRAMTWGSAYAEKAERDKGWLGPGTLADLAVLSDDVFTAPAERLPAITSVLTLVGGAIVYDPGVLTTR